MENLPWISWMPMAVPLLCPITNYILSSLHKPLLWPHQFVSLIVFPNWDPHETCDTYCSCVCGSVFVLFFWNQLIHASAVSGELSRGLCWSGPDSQMFGSQLAIASLQGPLIVHVGSPLYAISSSSSLAETILMAVAGLQGRRNIQGLVRPKLRTGRQSFPSHYINDSSEG